MLGAATTLLRQQYAVRVYLTLETVEERRPGRRGMGRGVSDSGV